MLCKNLSSKQVFEFVLQCGVAFLIEIDRSGVGCRPQLRGKMPSGVRVCAWPGRSGGVLIRGLAEIAPGIF